MDSVTAFYQAKGKHERQLNRLDKALCKWQAKDFSGIAATRGPYEAAVAALSRAQYLQHVAGLPRAKAESQAESEFHRSAPTAAAGGAL